MNRLLYLLVFFWSFQAPALAATQVEIELRTKTNLGIVDINRVTVKNKKIQFNGRTIDSLALLRLATPLRILSSLKPSESLSCAAGTYQHFVTREGKKRSASGCLNTLEAAKLTMAMREVRQIASIHSL